MIHSKLDDWIDQLDQAATVEVESVGVNLREIRAALFSDCEIFIEFFLADQLDMPVPEFHKEIWGYMTDQEKERVLLAIPRDHAKTTLAKLGVIWYWLFTRHRFCVYLSNTNAIAKGACKDIIEFLDTANFVAVFGRVNMIKSSENESLWIFEMVINGKRKRCILRALGQGQQMRGINIDNQRPDIAVVDDVEDNDNTASDLQQKSLDRWVFGPFMKALAKKKKIIWLGNMLSKTSLLARLSRNPRWNPVVFGALVNDNVNHIMVPLWPEKWTVEELQEDFKEYKDAGLVETWMCEMMNMPGHGENGFTPGQMYYQPQPLPDECLAVWLSVDPAFGLKAHNDESSIAVHALLKNDGVPMTVMIEHGRWDDVELFRRILHLAYYWNCWVWGVEAVAAQKVLISLFNILLVQERLKNHVEIIPLLAGRGDPKVSRIRGVVSLMAAKEWALHDGDIDATHQFMNYDFRKIDQQDDIVDSMAYGPVMKDNYLNIIMAQASGHDTLIRHKPRYGMEVANV